MPALVADDPTTTGPVHEHDCERCTFLGTTGPTRRFAEGANAIDHYVCVRPDFRKSDLIQRFGSSDGDCGSFSLEIVEAAFRDRYGDTLELLYQHPVYLNRLAA